MLVLTNAVIPFDGDEIVIEDARTIVDVSVDHSLANADCTRIVVNNGDIFQVQESVDDVAEMIAEELRK